MCVCAWSEHSCPRMLHDNWLLGKEATITSTATLNCVSPGMRRSHAIQKKTAESQEPAAHAKPGCAQDRAYRFHNHSQT